MGGGCRSGPPEPWRATRNVVAHRTVRDRAADNPTIVSAGGRHNVFCQRSQGSVSGVSGPSFADRVPKFQKKPILFAPSSLERKRSLFRPIRSLQPVRSWLGRRPTMAMSTPANANSAANISRVGPSPAITTACSVVAHSDRLEAADHTPTTHASRAFRSASSGVSSSDYAVRPGA
jgi:hypothetical protein